MEKLTSFDRVIGPISEIEKDDILIDSEEAFKNQTFKELAGQEREKSAEEIQIINLANEAINKIRNEYNLPTFNIPAENIHVIKEEDWTQTGKAYFSPLTQSICVKSTESKLIFLEKVTHEIIHFKSYSALQITNTEEPRVDGYRLGLSIISRDGKTTYFEKLDEAVTEELTKKVVLELMNGPLFNNEGDKTEQTKANLFTYKEEREFLNNLIDKIFEVNKEKFKNKDELMEIFYKGMLNGNIFPLAKLVDSSFGKGSFRRLGELDQKLKEKKDFIESL